MRYFIFLLLFSSEIYAQNKYVVLVDSIDNKYNDYKIQLIHGRIDGIMCDIIVSTSIVVVNFEIGNCYYLLLDQLFDSIFLNYRGDTVGIGLNIKVHDEITVKCSTCPGGELSILRRDEKRLQFSCLGVLIAPTFKESLMICD
jgi:hypothetical protein